MNLFFLLWLVLLAGLGGCRSIPPQSGENLPPIVETERFRFSASDRVIGQIARITVQQGDTLADIARHFGVGFQAIRDANPDIDAWLPQPGRDAVLPLAFILPEAPHTGIVLNLAAMRLFYFPPDRPGEVWSYPIGIGREGWETPRGQTRIVQKEINPSWVVPPSIRREHALKGDPLPQVVPPGPDNPLGNHVLRLAIPSYLIHGTNKPYGVGLRVSHGCIQLYPEDIAALFPHVQVGTQVTIVDQPYLIGWHKNELYLQVHAPLHKDARTLRTLRQALLQHLRRIELESKAAIDWQKVNLAIAEARGIPLPITKESTPWQAYLEQAPAVLAGPVSTARGDSRLVSAGRPSSLITGITPIGGDFKTPRPAASRPPDLLRAGRAGGNRPLSETNRSQSDTAQPASRPGAAYPAPAPVPERRPASGRQALVFTIGV